MSSPVEVRCGALSLVQNTQCGPCFEDRELAHVLSAESRMSDQPEVNSLKSSASSHVFESGSPASPGEVRCGAQELFCLDANIKVSLSQVHTQSVSVHRHGPLSYQLPVDCGQAMQQECCNTPTPNVGLDIFTHHVSTTGQLHQACVPTACMEGHEGSDMHSVVSPCTSPSVEVCAEQPAIYPTFVQVDEAFLHSVMKTKQGLCGFAATCALACNQICTRAHRCLRGYITPTSLMAGMAGAKAFGLLFNDRMNQHTTADICRLESMMRLHFRFHPNATMARVLDPGKSITEDLILQDSDVEAVSWASGCCVIICNSRGTVIRQSCVECVCSRHEECIKICAFHPENADISWGDVLSSQHVLCTGEDERCVPTVQFFSMDTHEVGDKDLVQVWQASTFDDVCLAHADFMAKQHDQDDSHSESQSVVMSVSRSTAPFTGSKRAQSLSMAVHAAASTLPHCPKRAVDVKRCSHRG